MSADERSGDNRPSVYFDYEYDRWVYRASALGSCDRELVAHRRGMVGEDPPEFMLRKYQEGHDWEAELMARFAEDQGREVTGEQMKLEVNIGTTAMVRGSIDGKTDIEVVDAKFLGPDLFNKILAKGIMAMPHYAWQQSAYFHALNAMGLGVSQITLAMGLKKNEEQLIDGKLVKVAVGIKQMHYEVITEADVPYSLGQIKARVMRLEKMAAQPPDVYPDCPVPFSFPCGFVYLHDEVDSTVEVTEPTLVWKVGEAARLDRVAKENDAATKALKKKSKDMIAEVLEEMSMSTEQAGQKIRAGRDEVTWVYQAPKDATSVTKLVETKAKAAVTYPKFGTAKEESWV